MTRPDDDGFIAHLREAALHDLPAPGLDPTRVLATSRRKRALFRGAQAATALVVAGVVVVGAVDLVGRWDRPAPPVDEAPLPDPTPTAPPPVEPTMCAELPPQPPAGPSYEGWWSSAPTASDGSILTDPADWPAMMREHPQTALVHTRTGRVIESFDRYACGPFADYAVPEGIELPSNAVVVLDAVTGEILETIPGVGSFTLTPTSGDVNQSDVDLIERFVVFALDPGEATAADLDLAPEGVRIGLADQLLAVVPLRSVADPAAWELELDGFRARVGPFTAPGVLQRRIDRFDTIPPLPNGGALVVSIGEHPGCPAQSVPPPPDVAALRRVSVQPAPSSIESCIDWFAVDFFVRDDGTIAAITLDLGEP